MLRTGPLLDVALALSFFPMAVAGPLARPAAVLPQLASPPDARRIPAARAFRLLLVGLFLVWVIAPYLRIHVVDPVFAAPSRHSGQEVLLAVYGFPIQLFAELAGYASMAIGAGLLLGIRLPENFDAPFTATSLREFWHRWTITFSTWFRDYVYRPLGGNRVAFERNALLTLGAAGLWFVGGVNGLVWGLFMGIVLVVEARVAGTKRTGSAAVVGWLITSQVISFGFVLVRAGTLARAGDVLGRLGSWGTSPLVTPLAVLVIAGVVGVQLVPGRVPATVDLAFSRLPVVVQGIGLGLGLLVIDALGQGALAVATVPARF
jgi:D-alanyl-lipoteichoic acid acyltransferase DltB (MBOAT superfamily)